MGFGLMQRITVTAGVSINVCHRFFYTAEGGIGSSPRATGSPSLCEAVIVIPIDRSVLQIYLIILIELPSSGKLFYSMIFADSLRSGTAA